MDLNSIVFTLVIIVLGGVSLVLAVSFLAYKVRNKQSYKYPVPNYQAQEYFQPQPATISSQYYQTPNHQQQRYQYSNNQQSIHNYRQRVSPYQVYTN